MNKVTLIGRVSKDVTYQSLANTTLAKFVVATTEQFADKTGKERLITEYHRVTAWGKIADGCRMLRNNSLVAVEGKIKTDKYTDKQGVEKYATGIQAASVEQLEGQQQAPSRQPNAFDFGAGDIIPF